MSKDPEKDKQDDASSPPPSKRRKTGNSASTTEMTDEKDSPRGDEKNVDGENNNKEPKDRQPRLNLTASTTTVGGLGIELGSAAPTFNPARLTAQFAIRVRAEKDKKAAQEKREKEEAEMEELCGLDAEIEDAAQEARRALKQEKRTAMRGEIRYYELMRVQNAGRGLRGGEARGVWSETMQWLDLAAQVGEVEDRYGWGLSR